MFHAFDNTGPNRPTPRPEWMALLSRAPLPVLEQALADQAGAPLQWLRKPETGLYMVQGRAGGTGERFNLGELTVTRCALRVGGEDGAVGVAYVMGRNHRQAQLAAVADALLQDPAQHERIDDTRCCNRCAGTWRCSSRSARRARSRPGWTFSPWRANPVHAGRRRRRMKTDELQQVRPGFHDAALPAARRCSAPRCRRCRTPVA